MLLVGHKVLHDEPEKACLDIFNLADLVTCELFWRCIETFAFLKLMIQTVICYS